MNHDREIGFLRGGIDLVHSRVTQRDTIDVCADFDPAKSKRLDAGEAARGQRMEIVMPGYLALAVQ